MSILSFDNGSNAKLRDSVARKIYEHVYAKIVELGRNHFQGLYLQVIYS